METILAVEDIHFAKQDAGKPCDGSVFPLPEVVGADLCELMNQALESLQDCSMSPTSLSKCLSVSRVTMSRLINSIGKSNPIEALASMPGPESLRTVLRSVEKHGGQLQDFETTHAAIDAFARIIRDQYGTRSALNAALSGEHTDARGKFEQSSRYHVFKGMSQILGVESKIWLASMMFTPNREDPRGVDILTIHGTSGLRRLRAEQPVHFSFGFPAGYFSGERYPERLSIDLSPFLVNTPAPLNIREEDGQIINSFAPEVGGKDAVYDMLASIHVPNGSGRYAAPGRTKRGTSVVPDVPVMNLVSDVILHEDIFERIEPELFVYNTMGKGIIDIEDPKRFVDRVATSDTVVDLGSGLEGIEINEIPKYSEMVHFLCKKTGFLPKEFRVHRLQVQYPIYGFQYAIAYQVLPPNDS